MSSEDPNKDDSWGALFYTFTQDTTFHGIKYIALPSKYVTRKILWVLCVLGASGLFTYFVVTKVIHLVGRPKSVDVEVIFNSSIIFPAVTLCNQNLFRLTKAHEFGLYDTIQDGFRKNRITPQGMQDTHSLFKMTAGFSLNSVPNNIDESMKYGDMTADGCLNVCLELHSQACCSVVFNKASRRCFITPQTPNVGKIKMIEDGNSTVYQRAICEDKKTTDCDFEKDSCNFVVDLTKNLLWDRVSGGGNTERKQEFPLRDFTTNSAAGSYFIASTKYARQDEALMSSGFLTSTKNTCMILHHQIKYGILEVFYGVDEKSLQSIWKRSRTTSVDWETTYIPLPEGHYRVMIKALIDEQAEKEDILILVAVDDIYIGPCDPAPDCKMSPMATTYSGSINFSKNNNTCLDWADVPAHIWPPGWQFDRPTSELGNICQNPDDDVLGPWCYVDGNSYTVEYCDVPYCACDENQFQCSNGRCIDQEQVCDLTVDCEDKEDELDCPNFQPTVSCDFRIHNCSYSNVENNIIHWVHVRKETKGFMSLSLTDDLVPNPSDTVHLLSPEAELTNIGCLILSIYHRGVSAFNMDVFTVPSGNIFMKTHLGSIHYENLLAKENYTFAISTDVPKGKYRFLFANVVKNSIDITRIKSVELEQTPCYRPTTVNPSTTTMAIDDNLNQTTPNGNMSANLLQTTSQQQPLLLNNMITGKEDNDTFYDETFTTEMLEFTTAIMDEFPPTFSGIEMCLTCLKPINKVIYLNDTEFTDFNPINDSQTIDCGFQETSCGYRYESSNLKWDLRLSEITDLMRERQELIDMSPGALYLKINYEGKEVDRIAQWLRLFSPIQTLNDSSCLTFSYFNHHVDIFIYEYSEEGFAHLATIDRDRYVASWQLARYDVKPGRKGFMLYLKHHRHAERNFGLDIIKVVPRTCHDLVTSDPKYMTDVNCQFTDKYWCGYEEVTPGPKLFYRSVGYDTGAVEPRYYVHLAIRDDKLSRRLLSPEFQVTEDSCMVFRYYIKGTRVGDIKVVTAVLVDQESNNETLVWRFYGPLDITWGWARADIMPGTFRLRLQIDGGWGTEGGFDDVKIKAGACYNESLAGYCDTENDSMFMCKTMFVGCMPSNKKCDGNPNCENREDELDCEDVNNPTQEPATNTTIPPVIEEDNEENPYDNLGVLYDDLSLQEMYTELGHNSSNLFYSCQWQDQICNGMNFTPQVTDMGLCYTFNKGNEGREVFEMSETGSRYGLRIMLNIEQYQYMRGPNTDAGIKVYLHNPFELPKVRDLGFAIAPGQHALIGVALSQAENLKKPWGDCGTQKLKYFEVYRYSDCELECDTDALYAKCKCRDAFMPADANGYPPICNVSQYFDCAVPHLNNPVAGNSNCSCEKPCNQSIYDPVLSYAQLSSSNVDNILVSGAEEMGENYASALEARHRLLPKQFISNMIQYQTLDQNCIDMDNFITKHTKGTNSVLARLYECSKALLLKLVSKDIEGQFAKIEGYESVAEDIFGQSLNVYRRNSNNLHFKLEEISVLTSMGVSANSGRATLKQSVNEALSTTKMQIILTGQLQSRTTAPQEITYPSNAPKDLLPYTFFRDASNCPDIIDDYLVALNTTITVLDEMINRIDSGLLIGETAAYEEAITESKNYGTKTQACFNEYTNLLSNLINWKTVTLEAINIKTDEENPIVAAGYPGLQDFLDTNTNIADALKLYRQGKTTKLNLYTETFPKDNEQEMENAVTTLVSGLKSEYVDKIRDYTTETDAKSIEYYKTLLDFTEDLSHYFPDSSLHELSSRLSVWEKPIVNKENPQNINNDGGAIQDYWPSTMAVAEFNKDSDKVIRELLEEYSTSIIDDINTFVSDLDSNAGSIKTDLQKIYENYVQYQEERLLNSRFVQVNFLEADIYFRELKFQTVKQKKAYDIVTLFSDIGGYMGLLLGASALTVVEVLDLIFYNGVRKIYQQTPTGKDDDESSVASKDNHYNNHSNNNKGYNNDNDYGMNNITERDKRGSTKF